jgi:hypothetical protein
VPQGSPKAGLWGPWLKNIGFDSVAAGATSKRPEGGGTNPNYPEGYTPRRGDIAVMPYGTNGHVCVWDGHDWVADFVHNLASLGIEAGGIYGMNVNPNQYPNQKYTIFRKP